MRVAGLLLALLLGGCAQWDSFKGFINQSTPVSSQPTTSAIEPAGDQIANHAGPSPALASSSGADSLSAAHQSHPPLSPTSVWKLVQGQPFSREMTGWGNRAGWTVIWSLDHDWIIPADTQFTGSFEEAATAAINTLVVNGALLRATFFSANKTLLVANTGMAGHQE